MKNYVGYVNDHSGSMGGLKTAAIQDYNATITATRDAASAEMLDTVVSVVRVGVKGAVDRQVVISNPHVLKPVDSWIADGGTPLYAGILDMIALFDSLPDARSTEVSFLVLVTTDGEATDNTRTKNLLIDKLAEKQRDGRWTFVFRVPVGARNRIESLGAPSGNIVEWATTSQGMAAATAQTQAAMGQFYASRSAGSKSSTVFYANAATVDTSALVDISNKVSLYVVDGVGVDNGIQIRDFILRKRSQYLKGAAFYQLTKTEPRVTESKLVAVRDRTAGKIFSGQQAREMIGLPKFGNGRIHPGDHKNYDIFIQSESVNRKLVKGTGLLYWEEKGVPFTTEELEKFLAPTPNALPPKPVVVQLPAVAPTNKPTKSPIPVTPVAMMSQGHSVDGRPVKFYDTRASARLSGKPVKDLYDFPRSLGHVITGGCRWFVYL